MAIKDKKDLRNTFIQQCSCAPRGHREHPWSLILCWERRRNSAANGQEGHSSISCYPASRAAAKDSRERRVPFSLGKRIRLQTVKQKFSLQKGTKAQRRICCWNHGTRLVLQLLIITSFLCKDFWLVIVNELPEHSHILTSHKRDDKNDCNIKAARF